MKRLAYIIIGVAMVLLASCAGHPSVPSSFTQENSLPSIWPDYTNVTIPSNIAPMNFMVRGADEVVARFSCSADYVANYEVNGKGAVAEHHQVPQFSYTYGEDNKVIIDQDEWNDMLAKAKGGNIKVEVFCRNGNQWKGYKAFNMTVAQDTIDPYLSYRVVPPTYVGFENLILRQRCLENFEENDIYNNQMIQNEKEGQCINCHSYQNYSTRNMQFHMRLLNGGTMIVSDGKLIKVNLKTDSLISAGVYPAWHPTEKIIAYSTDHTMQSFHSRDITKVEVQESASDLIIYDIEKNEVQTVVSDTTEFEVFPTWSPDGKWLYYCSAHFDYHQGYENTHELQDRYKEVKYNIYRLPFDSKSRSFGKRELVYDAVSQDRSAVMPWISHDGRYMVFAEGPWGMFHVWHPTADIKILDLQTGQLLDTTPMNSQKAESYPSFSSTGRWLLYESRRDDGNYTRPYIAYFDKQGKVHKGFEVPEEDPEYFAELLRCTNRPEFMIEPVSVTPEQFLEKAKEEPIRPTHVARRTAE